jgi:hypothetical protein
MTGGPRFSGITRLEKLMFLLSEELATPASVKPPTFEPFKLGPFSRQVYDALEVLRSIDMVEVGDPSDEERVSELEGYAADHDDADISRVQEPRTFVLTDRGAKVADALIQQLPEDYRLAVTSLVRRYAPMPLAQLLRYVYKQYPTFTTASLIRDQVLGRG